MLFYFIFGCVFIYIIIPLIDNLLSILSAVSDYFIYALAFKVFKIKKEMKSDDEEEDDETEEQFKIGFHQNEIKQIPSKDSDTITS